MWPWNTKRLTIYHEIVWNEYEYFIFDKFLSQRDVVILNYIRKVTEKRHRMTRGKSLSEIFKHELNSAVQSMRYSSYIFSTLIHW